MLVFLVLCVYIRTLQGAPLLPPHASSSMVTVGLMGRDSPSPMNPACGSPQCRSLYSIVQSCLLTIFACVWTSLHPNINGPRDSDWTCFKRKVVTMLIAVIAPELVLFWALRQRRAAMEISEKYNEKFATSRDVFLTEKPLWKMIVDHFQPLSEETTWRRHGQHWTTTHGFFIQMGGFILYDDGRPKEVLDHIRLEELLQDKAISAPTATERDLQDRSKGDAISKAIVVLQTTWFVFQCIARWGQHLPLSELEVLTLAFAVMNVAIYAAWWNKPQGVDTAICVPLKKREDQIGGTGMTPLVGEEQLALGNLSHTELGSLPRAEDHYWLRHNVQEDRERHISRPRSFSFILSVPMYVILSALRPFGKIVDSDEINKNDLRVPMFYTSDQDFTNTAGGAIFLVSCGVGTIFGAIHLLAWGLQFPSHRDLVLWHVSAIVLTVAPFLGTLSGGIFMTGVHEKCVITRYILQCVGSLIILLLPFYVVGRFVVIVIALLAIHDPPREVLRDISWTSYIPHF